ncbi:twin-arginine translocation signal domain-containing protein [Paracoccus marcusii]|nr:twin-arginine translocation signal domain-containing protein [Paracoccus marcusii]
MTRIDRRGLLRGAAATAGVALASPIWRAAPWRRVRGR